MKSSNLAQKISINEHDNILSKQITKNKVLNSPVFLPIEILTKLPVNEKITTYVAKQQNQLKSILDRQDKRLIVIAGPCSIHDVDEAIDYAKRLKTLSEKVADKILLVMRTYFEKPRTTIGWKGLINDPELDDSCQIERGLEVSRHLLIEIAKMEIPTATELLDPILLPFFEDLVSYIAIGARTCESQIHRQVASGLNSPVGLKNHTNGRISSAIEALETVSHGHSFFETSLYGGLQVKTTTGNNYAHVILRGGSIPNYDEKSIRECENAFKEIRRRPSIIIDCSHGNSQKKADNQSKVLHDCVEQIKNGNKSIVGFMLESNINAGKQLINSNTPLKYGVSVTDECIGWEETEELILKLGKL